MKLDPTTRIAPKAITQLSGVNQAMSTSTRIQTNDETVSVSELAIKMKKPKKVKQPIKLLKAQNQMNPIIRSSPIKRQFMGLNLIPYVITSAVKHAVEMAMVDAFTYETTMITEEERILYEVNPMNVSIPEEQFDVTSELTVVDNQVITLKDFTENIVTSTPEKMTSADSELEIGHGTNLFDRFKQTSTEPGELSNQMQQEEEQSPSINKSFKEIIKEVAAEVELKAKNSPVKKYELRKTTERKLERQKEISCKRKLTKLAKQQEQDAKRQKEEEKKKGLSKFYCDIIVIIQQQDVVQIFL